MGRPGRRGYTARPITTAHFNPMTSDMAMTDNGANALQRAIEHHKAGRYDEAAAGYRAALAADPGNAKAVHYLGVLALQAARIDEAVEHLGRAVALSPSWPEAQNNYGVALREQGRAADAVTAFRAAAAALPTQFDPHNNLAGALLIAGDTLGAIEAGEAAHRLNPEHPEPLLTIATAFLLRHAPDGALGPIHRVLSADPRNERALALYRTAMSRIVQPWHFPMMNDQLRNEAYDAAIRRAVTPGALVLDIGTGAGLLSMMAARAGARHVVTCEMTTPVAAKAQQIVAQNGLQDRITVLNKKSNDIVVGTDMPEKADVLVQEIFDSDLLSEGVLPSMEDAHARLLKPGAKLIPSAASAMVALVSGEQLRAMVRVDKAAGFDVDMFNEFMPERFVFDGQRFKFDWLSDPVPALSFDFRETRYPHEHKLVDIKATRSGLCLGVVQWLRIHLDEQTVFENHPNTPPEQPSGWMHSLYTFAPPVEVRAGQTVRIVAGHSRQFPYFRLAQVI
jgi:type III protein arginine methyltransferase